MKRRHAISYLAVAALLLCAAFPFAALAQQTADSSGAEIPARLRYLEGTVTVQRAAAGETEDAVINLPLGSGDRVWSADDGRVEIMFEDGTTFWLDARTTLDFVSLPRADSIDGAIVRLWTGSLFVQRPAARGIPTPLRLDAPNGTVSLDEAGLFRIDIDDEQVVWLSVYDGAAVLTAGGLSERVTAGRRTLAEAGSAPANAVTFNTSEIDDFTEWRDERIALLASTRQYVEQRDYVPSTVSYYAADLEPYGSWSYNPTYAAWYWRPYAAVAWSPYRDGRWVYTYSGWTWVPSAPWGWVTTHYGRWQYTSSGWIWFPGSVWSPASVHWYIGGDYVGWVPLDYWGRPAVSFGVHIGGGVGISVGVNFGGYYGWPYYGYGYPYYGYPYYGWGHPYWRYRPYYGCCGYGWNGWNGWGGGRPWHPGHYPSPYRDRWSYNGNPIGSASGTGRVVKGRGYTSGLANAWTMVPASELSNHNVGRAAVARNALPRGIDQGSKALVSGTLRARQPGDMLPSQARSARPTTAAAGRATPTVGANGPVRATTTTGARSGAAPRSAVARGATSKTTPGAVTGATRATATPSGTARRAVPPAGQRPTVDTPARVPSTSPSARPTRSVTGPARATTGQASPRGGAVAPRATVPTVSGAARATTRGRTTTTGSTRYPTTGAARYPSTGAARYPTTGAARYPSTGSVRSALPSGRTPSVRRTPTIQRVPTGRAPSAVRPAPSVGGARPSGGIRPTAPSRPGGSIRAPAVRRPGGSVRPPASSRPGGSVRPPTASRPGGSVRPSSAGRPGGGGARPAARPAKPRGGSGG